MHLTLHTPKPLPEGNLVGHSDETRNDVREHLKKLGTRLKHHYQTLGPPDVVGR